MTAKSSALDNRKAGADVSNCKTLGIITDVASFSAGKKRSKVRINTPQIAKHLSSTQACIHIIHIKINVISLRNTVNKGMKSIELKNINLLVYSGVCLKTCPRITENQTQFTLHISNIFQFKPSGHNWLANIC